MPTSPLTPIIFVALLLRLAWGLVVPVDPLSDSSAYDTLAWSLAQGNGFAFPGGLTTHWPVGTPFILSLVYRIFGHEFFPVVMLNVAVGVAIIGLSFALFRQLFNERVALLTCWLLAVWPLFIEFSTILASDLYYLFFSLLAFVSWISPTIGTRRKIIVAGMALAAATYIRPAAILLVFLLPFFDIAVRKWRTRKLLHAAGVAVLVAMAIAPWSIRNTELSGHFTLISNNFGAVLWSGNNPDTRGDYTNPPRFEGLNDYEANQILKDQAIAYIVQDPVAFLKRALVKIVGTHSRETIGVVWNEPGLISVASEKIIMPLKWISTIYWWGILVSAIGGVLLVLHRERWLGLFNPNLLNWGFYTGIAAVMAYADRYHVSASPFIGALAAHFLLFLWTHYRPAFKQFIEEPEPEDL